jgi:hypothetical protein
MLSSLIVSQKGAVELDDGEAKGQVTENLADGKMTPGTGYRKRNAAFQQSLQAQPRTTTQAPLGIQQSAVEIRDV